MAGLARVDEERGCARTRQGGGDLAGQPLQASQMLLVVAAQVVEEAAQRQRAVALEDEAERVEAAWQEVADRAEKLYAVLPPEQRDVFVAHEIEGISFADLSAQWRVPQNTLLARKHYAVLALRLRLQAEYGDLIV